MQDEDLDKIIREAASQHHPPYDNTAWDKMEQLLDKHLPQKKDRKSPYFLLLAFLLAGGLFYTFIYPGVKHTATTNKNDTVQNNTLPKNSTGNNAVQPGQVNVQPVGTGNKEENNTAQNNTIVPSGKNIIAPTVATIPADNYVATGTGSRFNRNGKMKMRIRNANATTSETEQDDNGNKNTLPTKQQKQIVAATNNNTDNTDVVGTTQAKITSTGN